MTLAAIANRLGFTVPAKQRELTEFLLALPTEPRIAVEREAKTAADRQAQAQKEAERAFRKVSAQYAQGRRAEREQDWAGAVTYYEAVHAVLPEYRDVAVRYIHARQQVQQRNVV